MSGGIGRSGSDGQRGGNGQRQWVDQGRWVEMTVAAEAMIDVWIRCVMCGLEAMSGGEGW